MEFNDYLAIVNLIYRYPQYTDKGDFESVGRYYAGTVCSLPGREPHFRAEGAAKFTETYAGAVRKFPDRNTPKTRHLIGNVIVEDDGPGKARTESYVVVFQQTDKLPLQPVIAGTYSDRFSKIDGVWRLVERVEDMELIGNLSEHVFEGVAKQLREAHP